jgi:transcriptional regulator with XRE-family HTH domain
MVFERLRAMKEACGMSWAELTAETGIPDSTLRKTFSGAIERPSFETVKAIVEAMGYDVKDVYTDVNHGKADISRDQELRRAYEDRIAELKESISVHRRDKRVLLTISCCLVVILLVFIFVFVADVLIQDIGWLNR